MNILKIHKLQTLFGVVIFVLFVSQIAVAIKISSLGKEITKVVNLQADLSRSNEQLREDIANDASLLKIASESARLGFVHSDSVLYLSPIQQQASAPFVQTGVSNLLITVQ